MEKDADPDPDLDLPTADGPPVGPEVEPHLSVRQAIGAYRPAVFWSLMVSMCVVMEGYDTILLGNFFAFPAFQRKYGDYFPGIGYQLPAPWQAGLGNAAQVGAIVGVLLNGSLVGVFGHKRVLLGSLISLAAFIALTFSAPNVVVLLLGQFLCGLPWGAFASTAPAYASEVLPLPLRVYLTSYGNMCFIIGQLIAAGVLAGLTHVESEWAYRIPFAIQWVWPALLIPILLFAPESPWHLVRKGRLAEAEAVLRRLQSTSSRIDPQQTLAAIVRTNRIEEELAVGSSYRDCFVGPERRRTEIACVACAGQVLAGAPFAYNSTYFFEQVGLPLDTIYRLNLGGTGMALLSALTSWFLLLPYVGRRRIYLGGSLALAGLLYAIGLLNLDRSRNPNNIGLAQASLTLVWTVVFQLSVGQLGWALPAEMGSTRLRQRTICLARLAYHVASILAQVLQPYLLNPTQWDLKGYAGFVWGSAAAALALWAFWRLPESRGRSFADLDLLFAARVPARRFGDCDVGGGIAAAAAAAAAISDGRHR